MKRIFLVGCTAVLILMLGCQSEFEKYYDVDDKAGQSVFEYLDAQPDYTLFTDIIRRIPDDFRVLNTTGLFTVFPVRDPALREFLSQYGANSIDEFINSKDSVEALEIINQIAKHHIIQWPFTKFDLVDADPIEGGGTFGFPPAFRRGTRYRPPMTKVDSSIDDTSEGVHCYGHHPKFLSFFNKEVLDYYDVSNDDLQALFPDKTISIDDDGDFYVNGVEILESDIPVKNGFIHEVAEVMLPLKNHLEILRDNQQFSTFHDLYVRNVADNRRTSALEESYSTAPFECFQDIVSFINLDLALEGNRNLANGGQDGLIEVKTLFAPTNQAMDDFFQEHFVASYADYSELPDNLLDDILESSIYDFTFLFPSQYESGSVRSNFQVPIQYNPSEVVSKQYASNGPFYEVNKLRIPDWMNTVLKPAIVNKQYSMFLYGATQIGYLQQLTTDPELDQVALILPSDKAFEDNLYRLTEEGIGRLETPTSNFAVRISDSELTSLISRHCFFTDLDFESPEIGFRKTMGDHFIGKENGRVWGLGNSLNPIPIAGSSEEFNGKVYFVDELLDIGDDEVQKTFAQEIFSNPSLENFETVLKRSGLVPFEQQGTLDVPTGEITFLRSFTDYTAFIPVNTAIASVFGSIPDDPEQLGRWIRYFFVEKTIFSDGENLGVFPTLMRDTLATGELGFDFKDVTVSIQGTELLLEDGDGGSAKTTGQKNIFRSNGVIHVIDNVLALP